MSEQVDIDSLAKGERGGIMLSTYCFLGMCNVWVAVKNSLS
jgi:hypothetical protein